MDEISKQNNKILEMNTEWQRINWHKPATDKWCDSWQTTNKSVIIETNELWHTKIRIRNTYINANIYCLKKAKGLEVEVEMEMEKNN